MQKVVLVLIVLICIYSQDKIILNNNKVIETEILEAHEWGLATKSNHVNFKVIKIIETQKKKIVEKLNQIIPNLSVMKTDNLYSINYMKQDIPIIQKKKITAINQFGFAVNSRTLDKYNPVELQLNSYSIFHERISFQIAMSISSLIRIDKDYINSFSFGFGYYINEYSFMYKLNHKGNNLGQSGLYSSIEGNYRFDLSENYKVIPGIAFNLSNQDIHGEKSFFYLNIGFEYSFK